MGRRSGPITPGHIWAFIIIGLFLAVMAIGEFSRGGDHTRSYAAYDEYRVESVYKGAVQLTDLRTGEFIQLRDPQLVRAALEGTIKKGDRVRIPR